MNSLLPVMGPVSCHECHAPGLYLFREPWRWLERTYKRRDVATIESVFNAHRCTARNTILDLKVRIPRGA